MARIFNCGFEGNQFGANSLEGLVLDGANTPSYVTTSPRSGTYCLETYATAAYTSYAGRQPSGSFARGYCRAAIYVLGYDDGAPPQNGMFAEPGGSRSRVCISSTGKMTLYYSSTLLQTGTVTLSLNTWYVILFQVFLSGASSVHEAKLYDSAGTTLLETLTDTTSRTTSNLLYFGVSGGAWNSANKGCRWDDFAVNDATGGSENSYPDPAGKILFSKCVSDNNIGAFTEGADGTSNLWGAVDNTPPIGNTTETATTNIKDVWTAAQQDNCDFNTASYTAIGIGASDTIILVQPLIRYGNHGTTASLRVITQIISNPTGSESDGVTLGVLAHGTEIANWLTHYGTVIYLPSITKGNQPVLRVGADFVGVGSGTMCFDFMAIIVEYVPAGPPTTFNRLWRQSLRPRPFAPGLAR